MATAFERFRSPALAPRAQAKSLQALNDEPYLAVSFEQPNGGNKLERAGHPARNAGAQFFTYGQDIMSPVGTKTATAFNGIKGSSNAPFVIDDVDQAHFCETGATYAFWSMRMGFAVNSYTECWMLGWHTNFASAIPFYWYNSNDSFGGRVQYWGNARAIATDYRMQIGRWHFITISVEPGPTGDVTIGFDGTYTVYPGVGMVPIDVGRTRIAIGQPDFDGQYARICNGAFFDLVMWDKPLSQAKCTKQLRSTGY